MNKNLNFRIDIEALRGFSVLLVIFYHFDLDIMRGKLINNGHIGVDLFFVISGYIITKIILENKKNSFSLINFYSRRIRRIIPLLVIVTTISLITIFFIFDYFLIKKNIKSAYAIVTATSNLYFWLSSTLYQFAEKNNLMFLHFWSLSLEMQFYIFFPLIFFFFKKNLKIIKFILIIIFFISYYFVLKNYEIHNLFNFYNSLSRAFELLGGSLFFIFSKDIKYFVKEKFFFILYLLGFTLIISYMYLYQNGGYHPNPQSLFFILGIGLMLIFNEDQKLYSIKNYFSKVGKISYSLYLWHFPLVVIGANLFVEFNDIRKIFLIMVCFLLSVISYNIVEKKFRKKNTSNSLYLYLFLIFFIFGANYIVEQKKNKFSNFILDNFYLADESTNLLKNKNKYSIRKEKNIFSFKNDSLNYSPQFNPKSKNRKILFVGDSHSKDLFNVFEMNKKLFLNFEFARYGINLVDFNNERKKLLIDSSNFKAADYIFFSQRYKNEDIKYIDKLIELSKTHNKKIILALKKPEFEANNYKNQSILDLYYLKNKKINKDESDYFFYKKLNKQNYEKINSIIKEKYSDKITLFDYYEIICDNQIKKCQSIDEENKKIFYDYGHFTLNGSKYLGKILYQKNIHNRIFDN